MNVNVSYTNIEGYANTMKQIASEINRIKNGLNYYYYGSIKSEGEYAQAFGQMKAMVQSMLYDMETFINGYSEVVLGAAYNLEALDEEIKNLIQTSGLSNDNYK